MRLAIGLGVFALFASTAAATPPTFPWQSSPPTVGQVPVRVLNRSATTPLEIGPPKQAYPYGWFGPNPTPQWKRSFGTSKVYTQWAKH